MDGNGRWASSRDLNRIDGHAAGEEAILSTIDASLDLNIPWLTLFSFSTENWNRPEAEVMFLMDFHNDIILRHGARFHRDGIRVRYMGSNDDRVPTKLANNIAAIQNLTSKNRKMTLTLAFNFGGRAELLDACRQAILSGFSPPEITENVFTSMFQYSDMPDVDLLIRTGKEYRLSNFMLWRCAYAELIFLDILWPDFHGSHVEAALVEFRSRKRRYGRIQS